MGVGSTSPSALLSIGNGLASGGYYFTSTGLGIDRRNRRCSTYDVLIGEAVALRGTFLIDGKGIVRHQVVNDLPLGRNVDEAIRLAARACKTGVQARGGTKVGLRIAGGPERNSTARPTVGRKTARRRDG